MAVKRFLLICVIITVILTFPVMLYLEDLGYINFVGIITDGDEDLEDSGTGSGEEEPIDFSSFIASPDKNKIIADKEEEWLQLRKERAEEEAAVEAARAAESQSAGGSTSTSQKEQQMLSYVNEARIKAGLPALTYCSQLTSTARAKSRDMIENNYFSHTSPRYGGLGDLLSHYGVGYRTAGENLAMNSSGIVREAHNSLMNSPGHRANILNGNFTHVGIGIQVKGDGSHYYTQLFVGY